MWHTSPIIKAFGWVSLTTQAGTLTRPDFGKWHEALALSKAISGARDGTRATLKTTRSALDCRRSPPGMQREGEPTCDSPTAIGPKAGRAVAGLKSSTVDAWFARGGGRSPMVFTEYLPTLLGRLPKTQPEVIAPTTEGGAGSWQAVLLPRPAIFGVLAQRGSSH